MARFIAEISSNHNGDKSRCLDLIQAAAACGCWAVKFQLFRIEQLFSPEVLQTSETHRLRRRWELPLHFLPELAASAREQGLAFGCTPFDLAAVDLLRPHVDFLKIASYELPWLDLVRSCAATDLPLMMSCGMANEAEVLQAVHTAQQAGCTDLTVMHCVSNYPVAAGDCNLSALGTLAGLLNDAAPSAKIGWSDHSVDPRVVHRAVEHWGADVIEFHFDLDGSGDEFGGGHCWLPAQVEPLVGGQVYEPVPECDGSPALVATNSESDERLWRADPSDGLRPTLSVRKTWSDALAAATDGALVVMVAGGPGLGHLARLLALAESLRDRHEARILFLIPACPGGEKLLARNGFAWSQLTADVATLTDLQPDVCVLDRKEDCVDLIAGLAAAGIVTVAIDRPDLSAADLGIVPCFGWPDEQNSTRLHGGPDYLLVRSDIARLRPAAPTMPGPRIVVSFGAEDPFRLTEKVALALVGLPTDVPVDLVIGPGFVQHRNVWPPVQWDHPNFRMLTTNDPLETILPGAGLLITALGVTIAEAHVLGIPTAVLANYETDAEQAKSLVSAGAIVDLGFQAQVTDVALARVLTELWSDPERRCQLAVSGLRHTDGQGARRAADLIAPLLKNHRPRKDHAC